MKKTLKIDLLITIGIIILGQLVFLVLSPRFLQISYSNEVFATIGVQENQENLQSLSEAANQFGQTMTGWLKFPNFMTNLSKQVSLPEGSSISAHLQERQNIIFTLTTSKEISSEALIKVKDYLQTQIDNYNKVSQTEFILTQIDYSQSKIQKTYAFGAGVTIVICLILSAGIWFLRKEI